MLLSPRYKWLIFAFRLGRPLNQAFCRAFRNLKRRGARGKINYFKRGARLVGQLGRDWHDLCKSGYEDLSQRKPEIGVLITNPRKDLTMNTALIDDSRIETRFVWARCAAQNARAMRDLIRAFQSDGWAAPRNVVAGKRRIRRKQK